jgi:acetyltransferase-like isoleucine patch superfamily enzyme
VRTFARICGAAGLGLYRLTIGVRARIFSFGVSGAFASFGRRTVIQLPVRLRGERRIAIGSDVKIGPGSWLETLGDGRLEIGDGSSLAGGCVLSAAGSVRLGRKVFVARNVHVSDHIPAFADPDRPVVEQGLTQLYGVVIGDGAWIGENVIVCPGVTIGRGAVISGNAVVREDVPDHALAVGIPAQVVCRFAPGLADAAPALAASFLSAR